MKRVDDFFNNPIKVKDVEDLSNFRVVVTTVEDYLI